MAIPGKGNNLNAIEEGDSTLKNTDGLTMRSQQHKGPLSTHVPTDLVMTLTARSQDSQDAQSQQGALSARNTRTRFIFTPQPRELTTPLTMRTSPRYFRREDTAATTHPDGFAIESPELNTARLFEELFKTGFEYEKKQINKVKRPKYSHAREPSGINEGMNYTSKMSVKAVPLRTKPREIGEVTEIPVEHSLTARNLTKPNSGELMQGNYSNTMTSFRKTQKSAPSSGINFMIKKTR